jgi:hypothetical protein
VWQAQAAKHIALHNEGKMSISNGGGGGIFIQNNLNSPLKENIYNFDNKRLLIESKNK